MVFGPYFHIGNLNGRSGSLETLAAEREDPEVRARRSALRSKTQAPAGVLIQSLGTGSSLMQTLCNPKLDPDCT